MFPRNSRYAAKLFHTSKTRWVWICLQVAVLMLRARHIYLVRPTPEENQLYGTTTGDLQQGINTGRCCVEAECEGRSHMKNTEHVQMHGEDTCMTLGPWPHAGHPETSSGADPQIHQLFLSVSNVFRLRFEGTSKAKRSSNAATKSDWFTSS